MREITNLREIQRIEYNILCRVVDFFEEHGISYFLCGGTLLGAIRHNGFIPWDDDIDISVPRKDYERFKALVRAGKFNLDSLEARLPGDKGYRYPFIKVVDIRTKALDGPAQIKTSVWIDIFPIDHYPDTKWAHFFSCWKSKIQGLMLRSSSIIQEKNYILIKRIIAAILMCLCKLLGGTEVIAKRIDFLGKKMDEKYCNSKHYGDSAWPAGIKDYFLEEWLFPLSSHQFEEREFNIPCGYHKYLTRFYGDYMTPPPKDERVLKHQLKAWWLSEVEIDEVIIQFAGK